MNQPNQHPSPDGLSERLRKLIEGDDYDGVLQQLKSVENSRPLHSSELLLRGRCIQLASPAASESLSEAEAAFRQALLLDEDYIPAILELAHFLNAVEDDPEQALPLFRRAAELAQKDLDDARDAEAICLEELGQA